MDEGYSQADQVILTPNRSGSLRKASELLQNLAEALFEAKLRAEPAFAADPNARLG